MPTKRWSVAAGILGFWLMFACTLERKVDPELDLNAMGEPLKDVKAGDSEVVDATIRLIQQKQHAAALVNLTRLTANNPQNAALRVLRGYVLLEVGNVTGSLEEARIAEESGSHNGYKCWFLAQVAYLAGDKPLCRREIGHLAGSPVYGAKAQRLSRELEQTN
jgi:predicted Zn-dependent protease